jgi:ABC-type multidrug transport system ATPase subunit
MNTIEVSEVSLRYRRGGGVREVSFDASPGESVALFGGAGSGKTTLLRLLAGRLSPDSGVVRVLERAPRGAARWVGYAPQEPAYPSLFSPHQVLSSVLLRHDVPGPQRPARIVEMLELFDLYEYRDRPARDLSHGERTALTLAAALVFMPSVLLMDNLSAALSAPLAARLHSHLKARRAADGLTVLHAVTRSEEAETADRALLLDAGRVLAFEPPDRLLANHAADTLTVEAADPEAVQRTLRGIFDVEVAATHDGLRFSAADGIATTAGLFRHPTGGVRVVCLRHPSLWDVMDKLKG